MEMKTNKRGIFIVADGPDRIGKSTQLQMLKEAYPGKAKIYKFPNINSTTGSLISSFLKKEIELDSHAEHLIFAANRWEDANNIQEDLNNGFHVFCDRWSWSGLAYSTAKADLTIQWCSNSEVGLVAPDSILYFDLDTLIASQRQNFGQDRYEYVEFQDKVRKQFKLLYQEGEWKLINAEDTIENIHKIVMEHIEETIKKVEYTKIRKLKYSNRYGLECE